MRELAYGIAALLNSVFLDRYFRMTNGNTQVSATELRAMPLPAENQIRSIGSTLKCRIPNRRPTSPRLTLSLPGFLASL